VKNIIRQAIDDRDRLQTLLFQIVAVILFLYSVILTLAPAVRYHSWQVTYRWMHWIGFIVWITAVFFLNIISVKKFKNRDPYLLPIISFLFGLGLLTIFRLNSNFGIRQSIWLAISTTIICIGIIKSDQLFIIRRYKYIWLFIGLLLTALTLILGIYPEGNGPHLWLGCCGIYFQPSEPLKLLLIIYLAAYLADQWPSRKNLLLLIIPTLVMFSAAVILLISQRDLGTASIFIIIYGFYIFLVTRKRRTLLIFLLILAVAGFAGYQLFDVIQLRVDSWINPWLDPSGKSYQVIQSIQAFAAGKLIGSGPGIGSPGVVPVALSDFIFAAIGEELGLFGTITIIVLYVFLVYRGFYITLRARNQYQQLLAAGISAFIAIQSILILGGNVRLLPLTGVTLPFISYGGSSLLTFSFAALLLLWVSDQQTAHMVSTREMKPYFFAFNGVLVAFSALALISGWWAIPQSDQLLNRDDNLRRIINDQYVKRGSILDNKNRPIAETVGQAGDLSRILLYPSLSATIGYSHPFYGQGGIESSMDPYLRGLQGIPSSDIWINQLIYSQPPLGLDVRVSIDLNSQTLLDESLGNSQGAAIVLNASTGEILALWTAPTFDSNMMEQNWENWLNDTGSPLINRVTQGKYPVGTLLSPFIMAFKDINPENLKFESNSANCAIPILEEIDQLISLQLINGCEQPFISAINFLTDEDISGFLSAFGWTENPPFTLPQVPALEFSDSIDLSFLETELLLSPLQVARASSVFSQAGIMPYPRLAMAVNTPQQGWVVLSTTDAINVLSENVANKVAKTFGRQNFTGWDIIASSKINDQSITWYVSGTQQSWQGTPLIFVLVLENESPQDVRQTARAIMNKLTSSE
jgi:cell division protein FtsW (lipid II flippase)